SVIKAFRAACSSRGSARVLIPRGRSFVVGEVLLVGPCTAKPITIDIQGTLLAYEDLSVYMNGAWILVERVDGAVVTGGGTLNGRGMNTWQYHTKDGPQLPVTLVFQTVTNSKINRLSFLYSMGFHIKITDSVNVGVRGVTVRAPRKSPNTDGIHLSNATDVDITDCKIGTGDDCISIGHGARNVLVARVRCGPGHGIRRAIQIFRRTNELNVNGVTVINCTMSGTSNGARIKTYANTSPKLTASTIIFQDLIMNKVRNPVIIDQHYPSKRKGRPSSVKLTDIHFRNIKGTTISPLSIQLDCSPTNPCEGVELSNINLTPFGQIGALTTSCSNARFFTKGYLNPR
ncbi:hypothetical protein M569_14940, partial [Genlisea aurea]